MKLRNKKTGEVVILIDHIFDNYKNLAELNEEWEDVPEEPKKYYYITSCGETTHRGYRLWENESIYDKNRKQIGNYFETKEEAEKAVEKLKAFKRLKDKGFRFSNFAYTELCDYARVNISATMINDRINDDLELLFGDEQ